MNLGILRLTWFGALALCVAVFIYYSVALPQLFGDNTQKAWQWLLPNILPPVGVVFGIQLAGGGSKKGKDAEPKAAPVPMPASFASGNYALAFSWLFILALLVSVFGVLFSPAPIDFLNMTNYWLAPLLGLAMAMLGAVFAAQAAS